MFAGRLTRYLNRIPSAPIATAFIACAVLPARAAQETMPASEALMSACEQELGRAMTLRMEDLDKPYFAKFIVEDSLAFRIAGAYGSLVSSNRNRSRTLYSDVRVGDYKFDNSNFGGDDGGLGFRRRGGRGGGARSGGAMLPIDDEPMALRQSLWSAADEQYKSAVETLAQKRAYIKDKTLKDRPDDFSKTEPAKELEPPASMAFDRAAWEAAVQRLSARFKRYPQIHDSSVQLMAGLSNAYILNSEGTRLRKADTGIVLSITAEGQGPDGMRFSDSLSYAAKRPEELPAVDKIESDIDSLVSKLTVAMDAPYLDNYTGPVLFDGRAAAALFRAMLARGVTGQPEPLGTQRRMRGGAEGLDKQLGLAVLPKSFQVYDDPTVSAAGGLGLIGHYTFDDEGVPARRVDIVTNGILKDLCLSRTPTRKRSGSNGHARQIGSAAPRASIGCLFIEDKKAVSDTELKERLIEAAREAGLEYGIRIASIQSASAGRAQMIAAIARRMRGGGGGGGGGLGDPVLAFKVFVEDGREEPVRGCEFGQIEMKALKDIIAAGKTPYVYNFAGGAAPSASIIAPAVLFEELELMSIDQENETLPILKAPAAREGEAIGLVPRD